MKMKVTQMGSTQRQTSELKKPNPPTAEAVAKAQFVDKTYNWEGAAPPAQPK